MTHNPQYGRKYGKRGGVLLALAALCAVLCFGCGEQEQKAASGEEPFVGVLIYKQEDAYIALVTEAIRKGLSGKSAVKVLYAGHDQVTQNDQIAALLEKGANALAVNIVDPQAVGGAVDAIKKAGVPVVFFNREPDLSTLKAHGKACFVGTTIHEAGMMQGEMIATLWRRHPEYDRNGDGSFQYLMLQANLDNPEATARTEYSVRQARDLGVEMRQVGETLFCNWDGDEAYRAVSLTFPAIRNSLELIVANNDSMALGAIRALNEQGFNLENGDPARFIPVVGVDAVPPAVEAITKGMMSGTVVQDGESMGAAVAAMLLNAISGKDFIEGLPFAWDESGVAVRIPYARYTNGE